MPKPLFVFGVARSGTNLVSGLLNAHSRVELSLDPLMPFFKALRDSWISTCGDYSLQKAFLSDCPHQDYYFRPEGFKLLDLVINGEIDSRKISLQSVDKVILRASLESPAFANRLKRIKGSDFRATLAGILGCIDKNSSQILAWRGTKEVWTIEFIPALARAYPEAKFVLIQRDPRGVIASLLELAKKDPTQKAHTISYMRHWRKQAALTHYLTNSDIADRIHTVNYEALVTNLQENLLSITNFLGLDLELQMVKPVMGKCGMGNTNSSFGKYYGVSNTSNLRWSRVLTPAMKETIEYVCGPEMLESGYLSKNDYISTASNEIERVFVDADNDPGSWRSDYKEVSWQLQREETRQRILAQDSTVESIVNSNELRSYFLFSNFFDCLSQLLQGRISNSQRYDKISRYNDD